LVNSNPNEAATALLDLIDEDRQRFLGGCSSSGSCGDSNPHK